MMEDKYKVPAGTFLIGLAFWIVLLLLQLFSDWAVSATPWPQLTLSLLSGGLIAYSGVRCRKVVGRKLVPMFAPVSYWCWRQ